MEAFLEQYPTLRDADPSSFVYRRSPTIRSFLWATWLCFPRWLRLSVYKFLLRSSRRTDSPRVSYLPSVELLVKWRYGTSVMEALATQYVEQNTTIPVPTILDVLPTENNNVLILMTRVSGFPLGWPGYVLKERSKQQQAGFREGLRDWLEQLRALPPPPGGRVCGFTGGQFYTYRFDFDYPVGPFESLEEFYICCPVPARAPPEILSLATRIRTKPYRLCFTHGDLAPHNILVDEELKPIGLIDFGCAAWLPEYWEFTYALWRRERYEAWASTFKQIFPQYCDELAVEREIWRVLDH